MKLWKLMLTVALVAVVVLALASCGCEHTYEEAVTKAPTCTEEGEKTLTCSQCGDVKTEAVPATGHTYTEAVTAPTCTEEGYTTYTCACGDTYKDNTVAATGHTYTETVTAPTCTVDGYTTYTCACGDTYTDNTVAATGVHTYEKGLAPISDELKATHPTALGVIGEVCSGCGEAKAGGEGEVVLVYLDFETEAADLVTYTTEAPNVDPYYKNSVTTGLIMGGVWYNTTYGQVLITDQSGAKNYNELTVSFDFLPCETGWEGKADALFAWGAHSETQAAVNFFLITLTDDGKLEYYRNTKLREEPTAALSGFTLEDRNAWYHIEFKVNVEAVEVAVSIGKYTDDTLTTLEDFRLVGTTKDTDFQQRGARGIDNFRLSNYNGVAAMDNFMVTVSGAPVVSE